MIPTLILTVLALLGQAGTKPTVKTGWAVHYSPGVFSDVLKVRQSQGLIPHNARYDGLAATTECSNIGKYIKANLRSKRTGEWSAHSLLVVDCSHPRDRSRHIRTGLVVEVDAATAREAGFYGTGRTRAVVTIP